MDEDTTTEQSEEAELLESAWGLIANAGGGNWDFETKAWEEAAIRWRDKYGAWADKTGHQNQNEEVEEAE